MAADAAPVIAVAGEAMVDLLPGGASGRARPGGSPANTAVALARLDVPVTLLARFGDDDHARLLRHHLLSNGADLRRAVDTSGRSSVARVVGNPDGSATYDFDIDGSVDWDWTPDELAPLPASVLAVHSGSLALARSRVLETWLRDSRDRATICIDPNLRSGLVDATTASLVERWLSFADALKVSAEDLALLCPGEATADIARRWCRAGPGLVVVTAGAAGAAAYFAEDEVHRDAFPVDVADTIGAGDAFTAGLLQALLDRGRLGARLASLTRDDAETALEHACAVAALTCTRTGADPPTSGAVRALTR